MNHQNKPWITAGILKSIRKKNNLYKRMHKTKSPNIETKYKLYKNKLTTIIRKAERQYYANKLQEMKCNISRTWKLLNQMTCINMTNKQITEIDANGTLRTQGSLEWISTWFI